MYVFIILIVLILLGIIENKIHLNNRSKLPIIIHVNGIRGKSTITRMITYGLFNSDYKVWGKTTGSQPILIKANGEEIKIQRRGQARVHEQIKIINKAALEKVDILVLECMAISPEIQFISGNRIVKPDISIISNIYMDHEEVMGQNLEKIKENIVLSIPDNGRLIITEQVNKKFFKNINYNFEINTVKAEKKYNKLADKFSYPNFRENVALAIKVADILELNPDKFIQGMLNAPSDPGVSGILSIEYKEKTIYFSNAFSGNDETSTLKLWQRIPNEYKKYTSIGILNIRNDRPIRTKKMIELYNSDLSHNIDYLYIIGIGNIPRKIYTKNNIDRITTLSSAEELLNKIIVNTKPKNILLFGFGNYKGAAETIIEKFKKEGKKCNV